MFSARVSSETAMHGWCQAIIAKVFGKVALNLSSVFMGMKSQVCGGADDGCEHLFYVVTYLSSLRQSRYRLHYLVCVTFVLVGHHNIISVTQTANLCSTTRTVPYLSPPIGCYGFNTHYASARAFSPPNKQS
jgi:hypothetical protein